MIEPCACGEPHPHEVMLRITTDGYHVVLWSDGAVTGALGLKLPGVPIRRPRTPKAHRAAMTAGRKLLEWVSVYSVDELGQQYAPPLSPRESVILTWTVLHADRDGRPRERVATLPRLLWPGLAVWDFVGRRDRYVLHQRVAADTYKPTGFAFRRLGDLWSHLRVAELDPRTRVAEWRVKP